MILAGTVLALAVATPAGAVTGYGAAGTLQSLTGLTASKSGTKHTCQARAGREAKTTSRKQTLVGTVKNPAVVACEQPPRSQVLNQGLKQAGAAALAALG